MLDSSSNSQFNKSDVVQNHALKLSSPKSTTIFAMEMHTYLKSVKESCYIYKNKNFNELKSIIGITLNHHLKG